jgi:hypothetical protein
MHVAPDLQRRTRCAHTRAIGARSSWRRHECIERRACGRCRREWRRHRVGARRISRVQAHRRRAHACRIGRARRYGAGSGRADPAWAPRFRDCADPESYEINRLQLTNTSLANTTITLGRQRINLDDQRFVGSVGWRQNEQTFDALRVIVRPTPKLTVDLVYADQVNRVFGRQAPLTPGSPAGRYHGDNYLANAAYQTPLGRIALFAYLLDFQEPQGIRDSSRTMGLRFSGERPSGPVGLAYALSYATQEDYADNPFSYEEDFYAVEVTGTFRQLVAGIGYEVLDGDGAKGFTTPLATLHRFDGWADKFLVTPPNGLERRYATLGYAMKGVGLIETLSATVVYHEFDSSRGRLDYGSELDLQVQAKWRRFSGLLKYADYRADGFATDTTKYWVQIEFIW